MKATDAQRSERDDSIERMFVSGMTCADIAPIVGCNVSWVRKIVRARGFKLVKVRIEPRNSIWDMDDRQRREAIWARAKSAAAKARTQAPA